MKDAPMSEVGNWLATEDFTSACAALPLVSIDLMVTRQGKNGVELLLGLRNNRPAQDWWFTPGGRIRKNEPLHRAMQRIASGELNLSATLLPRTILLGAWDHFYDDSAFSPTVSTHYVNLAYWLHITETEARAIDAPAGPDQQHSSWKWLSLDEATRDQSVHANVRAVAVEISRRCMEPAPAL